MAVEESLVCGPDGEIMYTVREDDTDLARANYEQRQQTNGWTEGRTMRQALRVPARLYTLWENRQPGCWNDKNFVRSFAREHPEYATCDVRSL